jgi:hypothetical protein
MAFEKLKAGACNEKPDWPVLQKGESMKSYEKEIGMNFRAREIFAEAAKFMNMAETPEMSINEIDEKLMLLAKELIELPELEIDDAYAAFDDDKMAVMWYNETVEYVKELKAKNIEWS